MFFMLNNDFCFNSFRECCLLLKNHSANYNVFISTKGAVSLEISGEALLSSCNYSGEILRPCCLFKINLSLLKVHSDSQYI